MVALLPHPARPKTGRPLGRISTLEGGPSPSRPGACISGGKGDLTGLAAPSIRSRPERVLPSPIIAPETVARLALLDESPIAFLALTTDWRCAYANAALGALVGRAPAELIGTAAGQLFSDSTGTAFEGACRFAMEERVTASAEALVTPPGRWVPRSS